MCKEVKIMEANEIVKRLTLLEKASLLEGANQNKSKELLESKLEGIAFGEVNQGIVIVKEDGKHTVHATLYPSNSQISCSFDPKLLFEYGQQLGKEAKVNHLDALYAPNPNVQRSALGSKNSEYFSEDPLLCGILSTAMVEGIQSQHVGSILKQYFASNQQMFRNTISSEIDERAMNELYLKPFQMAIQANPMGIMTSYHRINWKYINDSRQFLHDTLRNQYEYKGLIISEPHSVIHKIRSLKAGCQLEMPTSNGLHAQEVIEAIEKGTLAIETVDEACSGIVRAMLKAKGNKTLTKESNPVNQYNFSVKAAQESMVLLGNNGILPLSKTQRVLVVGELATTPFVKANDKLGIEMEQLNNLLEVLDCNAIEYTYIPAYSLHDGQLLLKEEEFNEIKDEYDVVLCLIGVNNSIKEMQSGIQDMELLPMMNELLTIVKQENTVVVVQSGGPCSLPSPQPYGAFVSMGYAGQGVYEAFVPLLYGEKDFSGKLAQSYPLQLAQDPAHPYFSDDLVQNVYKESLYVGYRYYTTYGIKTMYPFGHGLQYAQVRYHKFFVEKHITKDTSCKVSMLLENTSMHACKHVVQIYVESMNSKRHRPVRELKAIKKVELAPKEVKHIELYIPYDQFAIYEEGHGWVVEAGEYQVGVYDNAELCIFTHKTTVEGIVFEEEKEGLYATKFDDQKVISDESYQDVNPQFERMVVKKFTMNHTLFDLHVSNVPAVVFKVTDYIVNQSLEKDLSASQRIRRKQEIYSMPLEQLYVQLNGKVKRGTFLWLLATVNAFFTGKRLQKKG